MSSLQKNWFVSFSAFILFACIIGLSRTQSGNYDVDYCEPKNIKIQLVYVLDCTDGFNHIMYSMANTVDYWADRVKAKYGGIGMGLVCFSDYVEEAKPRIDKPASLSPGKEDCYIRVRNMTSSIAGFHKSIREWGDKLRGGPNDVESSLTALIFAAADKQIGWSEGNYETKNGKSLKVHKFIVLGTDEQSTTSLGNPGQRQPPKGDGTDTCSTTLPPNSAQVEKILLDKNINVVGFYENRNGTNAATYFSKYFSNLKVPYTHQPVVDHHKDTETLVRSVILSAIDRAVECEESDPEPYNTLGL